ncbi:MAG: hypothetical protein JWP07_952, partial [Pseudonocardiales bacterium]|nr:hypothetical protein [Pseudonocardiales bacterium]
RWRSWLQFSTRGRGPREVGWAGWRASVDPTMVASFGLIAAAAVFIGLYSFSSGGMYNPVTPTPSQTNGRPPDSRRSPRRPTSARSARRLGHSGPRGRTGRPCHRLTRRGRRRRPPRSGPPCWPATLRCPARECPGCPPPALRSAVAVAARPRRLSRATPQRRHPPTPHRRRRRTPRCRLRPRRPRPRRGRRRVFRLLPVSRGSGSHADLTTGLFDSRVRRWTGCAGVANSQSRAQPERRRARQVRRGPTQRSGGWRS